jgi:hypothetical protein
MSSKLIDSGLIMRERLASRNRGFHERFSSAYTLGATTTLNSTLTGSTPTATIAANATGGGKLTLFTDTTVNNEAYAFSALKLFIMAANQPVVVEGQMSWTEANTNKAGVVFGLASASPAGLLVNTTGAPIATTNSAAYFYKLQGTLNWHAVVQIGTTQVDQDLTTLSNFPGIAATGVVPQATSDANEHVYTVSIVPQNSTQAEAVFQIDGAFLYRKIFTYTGAVAMSAVVGIKNLNGTNAETLVVSDLFALQQCLPVTALQV